MPIDSFEPLSQISLFSFALAFLAGLVMGFSPVSLPLLPVITGYVVGSVKSKSRAAILSLGFMLGITTVYVLLGIIFALSGELIEEVLRFIASRLSLWNLLIAALLFLLGLHMTAILRLAIPSLTKPVMREAGSPVGAYLLGIPFGLAACPSCTPFLLAVLVAAGATGRAWYGGALLFTYSLGFGVPLLLVGTFAVAFKELKSISKYVPAIEKVGGVILLAASVYFFVQFIRLSTL